MPLARNKQHLQARKIERIEARLHPEQRRRIEHAATLEGTSISDFIISSADAAALRAIHQHEIWTLSGHDREAFVKSLLHPPAPNSHMKAAARRYRTRVQPL
jgi:uncharacterized protein (DUF1778 family)